MKQFSVGFQKVFFYYASSITFQQSSCYRTCAHQNKIKPNQAHFHPLCEIYKLKHTPFVAFQLSPLPLSKIGAFLTETVLFDLARQETTNSAPLSRNICLKFLIISLLFYASSSFFFFVPCVLPRLCF